MKTYNVALIEGIDYDSFWTEIETDGSGSTYVPARSVDIINERPTSLRQVGKRVPVPLIQGAEDALLWLSLLGGSRFIKQPGAIAGAGMFVWGIVRALDEKLLLGQQSHSGSVGVQISGIVLSAAGLLILLKALRTKTTN